MFIKMKQDFIKTFLLRLLKAQQNYQLSYHLTSFKFFIRQVDHGYNRKAANRSRELVVDKLLSKRQNIFDYIGEISGNKFLWRKQILTLLHSYPKHITKLKLSSVYLRVNIGGFFNFTRIKSFPLDSFMKILYGFGAAMAELFYPPGTNKLYMVDENGNWVSRPISG